jgi:hypothetical protein
VTATHLENRDWTANAAAVLQASLSRQ